LAYEFLKLIFGFQSAYVADNPDALVFTGPSGRPMRRSNFNKAVDWKRAVEAVGVPHLHLHDLRHTGNTLAAGTPGTSTRDLMERMGHDNMRAALIYQHTTRDADKRIADGLRDGIERAVRDDQPAPLTARGQHAADGTRGRRLATTPRRPVFRGLQRGAGDGNRTRTVSLGTGGCTW